MGESSIIASISSHFEEKRPACETSDTFATPCIMACVKWKYSCFYCPSCRANTAQTDCEKSVVNNSDTNRYSVYITGNDRQAERTYEMDEEHYNAIPFAIITCGTMLVCKAVEWLVLMVIG